MTTWRWWCSRSPRPPTRWTATWHARATSVSTVGKLLDPLADKLLISAALISLVGLDRLAAWVAMVIIAREFAVTGLRLIAASQDVVIAASPWGKIKTTLQVVAVIALIVDDPPHTATTVLVALRGGGHDLVGDRLLHLVARRAAGAGMNDGRPRLRGRLPARLDPVRVLAGRLRGVDLRKAGSGNTGGTNAVRVLGARVRRSRDRAGHRQGRRRGRWSATALGGTNGAGAGRGGRGDRPRLPRFLGFRGGKAVATGAGAMMALVPWIGVTVFFIWIALVGLITRYVSVASIAAALSYWALCVISGQPWAMTAFTVFGAGLVIWRHRANIVRLRNGTEPRFNRAAIRRSRPSGPPSTGPPGSG